jgi:hypothetical protein
VKKLPPNARRVIVNGNPSIAYEDDRGRIIRLERDIETELAMKPVNQRYAKQEPRFVSRGKALSDIK